MSARTVRLSEITSALESGGRPKGGAGDVASGVLSLGGEHVSADGTLNIGPKRFVPIDYYEEMNRGRLKRGDVLIVKDGATTGKVGFVDSSIPLPAAVNEHVFRLEVDENVADQHYVFFHLLSPVGNRQILQDFRGATVGGISQDFVEFVELPLPELSEQKRIAGLLKQADRLRRMRRYALELSDTFLPAAFLKFFGGWQTAAKKYPVKHLEEVVQQGRGVTYGIVQAGPHVPDGIPYIKTGDIIDGVIRADGLSRTSREIASSYRRSEVKFGDLVMSIRATVGTIAVLPKELDGANLTQGTARISPGPEVEKLFLLWQIRMPEAQRWITQQVKGSTFFEITLTRLREMPVFLPSLLKQQQFSALTERHERLRAEQREALRQTDHLFQSLLERAFSCGS